MVGGQQRVEIKYQKYGIPKYSTPSILLKLAKEQLRNILLYLANYLALVQLLQRCPDQVHLDEHIQPYLWAIDQVLKNKGCSVKSFLIHACTMFYMLHVWQAYP